MWNISVLTNKQNCWTERKGMIKTEISNSIFINHFVDSCIPPSWNNREDMFIDILVLPFLRTYKRMFECAPTIGLNLLRCHTRTNFLHILCIILLCNFFSAITIFRKENTVSFTSKFYSSIIIIHKLQWISLNKYYKIYLISRYTRYTFIAYDTASKQLLSKKICISTRAVIV